MLGLNFKCIQLSHQVENSNADVLSRLPLPEIPDEVPLPGETILLLQTLDNTPVNSSQIRGWTNRDPVLSRVRNLVLHGWTYTREESLQPYQKRKMN